MFTGIIKSISVIKKSERRDSSLFLSIATPRGWKVRPGDSIITNGVCLTVAKVGKDFYTTELMKETLSRTTFGLEIPAAINLEQSLKLSDRVDGHFVTGHIDCVGKIVTIIPIGRAKVFKISYPRKFSKLVASKGSIAVDGVSLTVVEVGAGWFTVSLVDYTLAHTTLGKSVKGAMVNLEFDILAKYAQK